MKKGALAACLWLATVALFWQARDFGFFDIDDGRHIYANPDVDPPSLGGVLASWRNPNGGMYLPVTYTFWAAQTALARKLGTDTAEGRPDPRFFHIGNIALHATNAVLVYWILLGLFSGALLPSLLGALCFAWHPIQVESVAWVSCLKDLLSGFFGLTAILLYVRFLRGGRMGWYFGALGLFCLGILAKPSLVSLPLLLFAVEVGHQRRPIGRAFGHLTPWLLPAFLVVWGTHSLQPIKLSLSALSWGERVRVALDSLGFYFSKLLFPRALLFDYGRSPSYVLENKFCWLCILPLALLALALADKNRRLWMTAIGISLGAGMVTTLGIFPFIFQFFSTVADRYVYLSLLGAAVALGGLCLRFRKWGRLVLSILVATFAMLTGFQQTHWRDSEKVFRHTLRYNPHSSLALGHLGLRAVERGSIDEGFDSMKAALISNPEWGLLRQTLAQMLAQHKRYAEAEEQYLALQKLDPENQGIQWELGQLELARGNPAKAATFLERISQPGGRPVVRNALAEAYFESGAMERAFVTFAEAAREFPEHGEIFLNWADALERSGRMREALAVYKKLLDLRPDEQAGERRARLLGKLGLWNEAAEQYRKIILFSGESPIRLVWLGGALLQSGHSREAIEAFEAALDLDGDFRPARKALAAARLGHLIGWAEMPSE